MFSRSSMRSRSSQWSPCTLDGTQRNISLILGSDSPNMPDEWCRRGTDEEVIEVASYHRDEWNGRRRRTRMLRPDPRLSAGHGPGIPDGYRGNHKEKHGNLSKPRNALFDEITYCRRDTKSPRSWDQTRRNSIGHEAAHVESR